MLERLAEEFKGDFLLAKVNTEENPEIAQGFGIRSIPNVKVFKGGAVVDEFMGAISEGEARHFLRFTICSGYQREEEPNGRIAYAS